MRTSRLRIYSKVISPRRTRNYAKENTHRIYFAYLRVLRGYCFLHTLLLAASVIPLINILVQVFQIRGNTASLPNVAGRSNFHNSTK